MHDAAHNVDEQQSLPLVVPDGTFTEFSVRIENKIYCHGLVKKS